MSPRRDCWCPRDMFVEPEQLGPIQMVLAIVLGILTVQSECLYSESSCRESRTCAMHLQCRDQALGSAGCREDLLIDVLMPSGRSRTLPRSVGTRYHLNEKIEWSRMSSDPSGAVDDDPLGTASSVGAEHMV